MLVIDATIDTTMSATSPVAGLASTFAGASLGTPISGDTANGPTTNIEPVEDGACAICLDVVDEVDVALVKQCLHSFCTPCIVRWTTFQLDASYQRRATSDGRACARQTSATCPCCKTPFDSLLIYRSLDGDVSHDLREESVCLLRRARWLPHTQKEMAWENDHALAVAAQQELDSEFAQSHFRDFQDDDDFLDEEERYMTGFMGWSDRGRRGRSGYSSGSSSQGIVIGNRRFGPNGQIAQGHRVFARPVPNNASTSKRGKQPMSNEPLSSPPKGKGKGVLTEGLGSPLKGSSSNRPIRVPVNSESPVVESPFSTSPAARGKKAQKRLEAKAKKESKDAARRAKRVEQMAASLARAKAKCTSGSLESKLPDLSDVEGEEGEGEDVRGESEETPVATADVSPEVFVID